MKNILLNFIFFFLFLSHNAFSQNHEEALKEIPTYKQTSVFADTDYLTNNKELFYLRKDIYNLIDYKKIDLGLLNACMLYATNKIRAKYKKPPLSFNNKLRNAAMMHSYLMVKQDFFSHDNPRSPKYSSMKKRIEQFGYEGQGIAENIAKNYIDIEKPKSYIAIAELIINQFYNSPPHKLNMLNPLYTECGQACYFYSNHTGPYLYFTVTQDYGYPWKN